MLSSVQKTSWSRTAVVYQIYPRSFRDAAGKNGVGDLAGIIEKLDYLNDGTKNSLGVTAIWLNPIYQSPMCDFGYDITDHCAIDPVFGDLETFDRLVAEAHKRGIKIIMDFVANHTSVEHPWFTESRSSKNNSKRDWYVWRDAGQDGGPPNNWLSVFGGSAWELDPTTGQYYLHSFLKCQPDLNWRNADVHREMEKVLRFWLARGVDGFRTDAAHFLMKDPEFRDDPANPKYVAGVDNPYESLLHVHSQGAPDLAMTTNGLCDVIGEDDDAFMVSEAYVEFPEMIQYYKACGNRRQAPLNFGFLFLPWSARLYKDAIDQLEKSLGPNEWPNYVFGNHDYSRVATRLGQERVRLAAMLLFTLRGMPFVYYGDELGMENVKIPAGHEIDPFGKNVPGFDVGRDPERTPMQWNANANAGFSDATPWLPVAPDYKTRNVAAQSADKHSMLSLYKKLIHLRADSSALLSGAYVSMESGNENVFIFARQSDSEKMIIAINFSDEEQTVEVLSSGSVIFTSYSDGRGEKVMGELRLRVYEGVIIA